MAFLYEKLEDWREIGHISAVPSYITDNLNPAFELRPYQTAAFENYITWYESDQRPYPIQNLFHMATGSGKTLIMAGLMLYLYKQGYRNFLFFVNLTNIVQKTKDNFLNHRSSKYLFADEIIIDGERVRINEVSNFQYSVADAINIMFTTTQALHMDLWFPKENGPSIDDFRSQKVVLISDEAHHLNADTCSAKGRQNDDYRSWETTVRTIFEANRNNVLLEFTATCDLANANILAEYKDKIIFNYPLVNFRADLYSKEIMTLRCDISIMDRAIQAVVLSQYRMKVFQDYRLNIKPVVLFKSQRINSSIQCMEEFAQRIAALTGAELERISKLTDNETMRRVWAYFAASNITFEQLAQELKEDFAPNHCISVNDDNEASEKQLALNSLEDAGNPYRAIFEVKKLDEGWDVLNLFDIVRMYETRQSSGRKLSPWTVSEAQLIGRGARYCPFQIDPEQDKYKRKYDHDTDNPLRICEQLYYHCQNDSKYILELKKALRQIGIDIDKTVTRDYIIKENFKRDTLYKQGFVFANKRIVKSRDDITSMPQAVREHVYTYRTNSGDSGEDTMFSAARGLTEHVVNVVRWERTIAQIAADINFSIIHKALRRYSIFRFDILKRYFPKLKSVCEFITSADYLGNIKIEIYSPDVEPGAETIFKACQWALADIAEKLSAIQETYTGSREFYARRFHDIFGDKRCNYTDPHDGGTGISQNDAAVSGELRLDLSQEDWFVFNDNYGTSEEKAFVAYFKKYVDALKEKYDKVYLVRNERQLHIYSFDDGERFEPDYLLFLHKQKENGYEQLQIFIEPKGTHLIAADKWKEDFMLRLKADAVPVVIFADDNDYKIWGFHFFNHEEREAEFKGEFDELLR